MFYFLTEPKLLPCSYLLLLLLKLYKNIRTYRILSGHWTVLIIVFKAQSFFRWLSSFYNLIEHKNGSKDLFGSKCTPHDKLTWWLFFLTIFFQHYFTVWILSLLLTFTKQTHMAFKVCFLLPACNLLFAVIICSDIATNLNISFVIKCLQCENCNDWKFAYSDSWAIKKVSR